METCKGCKHLDERKDKTPVKAFCRLMNIRIYKNGSFSSYEKHPNCRGIEMRKVLLRTVLMEDRHKQSTREIGYKACELCELFPYSIDCCDSTPCMTRKGEYLSFYFFEED